ncbi:MAG: hypothetical protein DWI09_07865 [Planctomycetota bacterium]|nr:MAG: hypothetical protein DWI09_07865 [Planctomycetota bacterium]
MLPPCRNCSPTSPPRLSTQGLSTQGLSTQGLSAQGLSAQLLSTQATTRAFRRGRKLQPRQRPSRPPRSLPPTSVATAFRCCAKEPPSRASWATLPRTPTKSSGSSDRLIPRPADFAASLCFCPRPCSRTSCAQCARPVRRCSLK